jgi:hypothetical protein
LIPLFAHRLLPGLRKDLGKQEKALPEHLAEPSRATGGPVARTPRKAKV